MKLLVVSNNYPNNSQPHKGAFVYNLMQCLADYCDITIISAQKPEVDLTKYENSYGEEKCKVLRPFFLSFGNKKIGGLDTSIMTRFFYKRAILDKLSNIEDKPNIIYAHFLTNALPVLDYAEENNIPLVIASGESTYTNWRKVPERRRIQAQHVISKVICVSQGNKSQLMGMGFDEKKIIVIPNAVDFGLFRPLDKYRCKEMLGLKRSDFVVGFIGHFIHRKGPDRVIEAIERLDDSDIKLVCVGNGDLRHSSFTTVMKPVANNQLPEIYNAFDVFVLPTLHEGHCNVIEEAKACRIPIISSKGTSVETQVSDDEGVLINPLDIDEISNAIKQVKEGRFQFKPNAVKENSIQARAKRIFFTLKNELTER